MEALYASRERDLNRAYERFKSAGSSEERFFHNLRMQLRIFEYEVMVDACSMVRNQPQGFARVVAMKGLIHKFYEFNELFKRETMKQMLAFAKGRAYEFTAADVGAVKSKYKGLFSTIERWTKIRNLATGHYDRNMQAVVDALDSIDLKDILATMMDYARYVLEVLAKFTDAHLKFVRDGANST
ncbi:hypothetical protein WJ22_20740 [Burkholderia vietnamiensis]|nr:hypothetical protein WJ18_02525 [Burkholderia vietnamiensis]KVF84837.1 hypothetical protein WJ20_27515 [Burkholderia vietnamiensis]KVF87648.1 hypothetical protein WJ19_09625 [Burkholderia vietnamiensis]KVF98806.1 hypothetical protein WJ22_20740 [Burkholderia vietnamiensis]